MKKITKLGISALAAIAVGGFSVSYAMAGNGWEVGVQPSNESVVTDQETTNTTEQGNRDFAVQETLTPEPTNDPDPEPTPTPPIVPPNETVGGGGGGGPAGNPVHDPDDDRIPNSPSPSASSGTVRLPR